MTQIPQLITEHLDIWTSAETEKKSGRGRSSGNGDMVYGIKKLRELILELAVRGKLVPQDPEDEPASELLKRIQAEKARLVKEGKIKKDKALPEIGEEEKPCEIPSSWLWVHLSKIITGMDSGWSPACLENSSPSQNIWGVLKTTSVQVMQYLEFENKELPSNLEPRPEAEVQPGDILFTRAGPMNRVGISCLVDRTRPKLMISDKIIRFHPIEIGIYGRYIALCLNAGATAVYLEKSKSGMAASQVNVSQEKLRLAPVPIAPLPEQHRIVAKVDELMALCDQLETQHNNATDAHEKLVTHLLGTLTQSQNADDFAANWQRIAEHFDTLFTTEHSIDTLKQTVLQLAVMGKLVPQDPNDEPASELLKRIQAEKTKLIAAGKIKKEKPLPPISDEEKHFELPNGWVCGRLGELLEIVGGVTLGRKNLGSETVELPYLRVANVQRWYLDLDSIKTVEIRSDELQKYKLEVNDLLVTEGGDWDKVGRTAIWRGEIDNCLHQNHIFRMRIPGCELSSSWVELYMNSAAKQYFQSAAKQTTNLASINMTQLKSCVLGVPPVHEQSRIIGKVQELMSLCDHLKTRITESSQLKQKLADALVAQALTA